MTDFFADTTDIAHVAGAIDDALRSLRISGSLLLAEHYAAPWAVAVPDAVELRGLLGLPAGTHVATFHLVEYGHCEIKPQRAPAVLLNAGDIAICFGGASHKLAAGKAVEPQSFVSLLSARRNRRRPRPGEGAAGTSLLCGVFLLHHTELNPLLADLPPLLHTTLSQTGALHNLSGVGRLLAEEVVRSASGSGYVIERLLEVLCAEAIRAHAEAAPRHVAGWFRGIKDPVAGRAIAAIHANPGDDWSIPKLASEVSMSPSRFSARFTASLGASPMAYVAKWRMNVACSKLSASRVSIEQIAMEVGYESHAAFNRAFKKFVGVTPSAWRTRVGA
ncbi:MAG: AraC family transcriptional regulator [Betaproteobacteria bacterium]